MPLINCFNQKKVPDSDVPHIEVLLEGLKEEGKFFYTHTMVRVYSPVKNQPPFIMKIWKSVIQPKSLSPDILVNLAKTQLDDAARTLINMKELLRAAKERVKTARAFPTIFHSREEYENACKTLGAQIFSDDLCQSYRIQFGEFKFPDFSGDHCLTLKLARRRLRGILEARNKGGIQTPFTIPNQGVQQWEPCKICSEEPRFLPLMLCEQCWPRKY